MGDAHSAWLKQEHQRRVMRLGEHWAEEWEQLVAEHAVPEGVHAGYLPPYKVLQLMEDIFRQGITRDELADAWEHEVNGSYGDGREFAVNIFTYVRKERNERQSQGPA